MLSKHIDIRGKIFNPQRFRERLSSINQPVAVLHDVHDNLLEDTWVNEYREVYRQLMNTPPPTSWICRQVIGHTNLEVATELSRIKHIPLDQIWPIIDKVRLGTRNQPIKALIGARGVLEDLFKSDIPYAIISKPAKSVIISQFKHATFLLFVNQDDIFAGTAGPVSHAEDLANVEKICKQRFKGYAPILFDDWYDRTARIHKQGGLHMDRPQGATLEEFIVHQQILADAGADFNLMSWGDWQSIFPIIVEHNKKLE